MQSPPLLPIAASVRSPETKQKVDVSTRMFKAEFSSIKICGQFQYHELTKTILFIRSSLFILDKTVKILLASVRQKNRIFQHFDNNSIMASYSWIFYNYLK